MVRVGFDIGGTNIKAGIVDAGSNILVKRNVPFPKRQPYEKTVEVLTELVYDMLAELSQSQGTCGLSDVESIGIAVPGSIDTAGEMVIHAHNLGFHDVPLRAAVEKHFPQIPVRLANDANAAALAELHAGAFYGCSTAVLLTLGTGVGGGLILGGKMFNGGMGHGVELGHITLMHGGPKCTCGNHGCIETVCTATWLTKQGRKVAAKKTNSLICQKVRGRIDRVNAKTVIDSAKEGDPEAIKIFDRYVDYLSSAITSIAVLLDPEVIALGGGVSLSGDFLFDRLINEVEKKSFFNFRHQVVPAVMGNDAGIVGAAQLLENER